MLILKIKKNEKLVLIFELFFHYLNANSMGNYVHIILLCGYCEKCAFYKNTLPLDWPVFPFHIIAPTKK